MNSLRDVVTEAVDTFDGDHIVTKNAAASLVEHLLDHLAPYLDSVDLNARAYGWEVGRTGVLAPQYESMEGNPFTNPLWRDKVTA